MLTQHGIFSANRNENSIVFFTKISFDYVKLLNFMTQNFLFQLQITTKIFFHFLKVFFVFFFFNLEKCPELNFQENFLLIFLWFSCSRLFKYLHRNAFFYYLCLFNQNIIFIFVKCFFMLLAFNTNFIYFIFQMCRFPLNIKFHSKK